MTTGNYKDEAYIAANQNIKEREYWLNQLSGDFEKSHFPFSFKRDHDDTHAKEQVRCSWTNELFTGLMKLSGGIDVKFHMILVAGLKALLYKYTNSKDILIGSPVLKQEIEGELINTILVYRTALRDNMSFKELLLRVRETIIQAAENQNFPIGLLPEFLDLPVLEDEFPLFAVALLLENIHHKAYLKDICYHLLFSFLRTGEAVEVTVEYSPWLYEKQHIERILEHFKRLLSWFLEDVNRPLPDTDILSEADKQQLLVDFNNTYMEYPQQAVISALFENQAAEKPHHTAVVYEDPDTGTSHQLSYKELNEKANQLARVLREKGVRADMVTAIMLERSLEMIIAVMAVIKAGGAYLPIDPTYPEERINFMLADSDTPILITRSHLAAAVDFNGKIIDINSGTYSLHETGNLEPVNFPFHLVYVIYTSGSTGKPKGVMVQHSSFVNAAVGWRKEYNLESMPVNLLQMASFSFDVSCGDLARALLNGGKMVITPEAGMEPEFLYQLISNYEITLLESTPSYIIPFMQYIYDNQFEIDCLKLLIVGSDTCRVQDFNGLLANYGKQMRIINSYGVTEATIDSSYYEGLPGEDTVTGTVPIGKPLPNVKFYILDIHRQLMPVGVPGELYIGGSGIARGYLNHPELTYEKFDHDKINKSFCRGSRGAVFSKSAPLVAEGKKLYKTGDRARWLGDGNVEFLGRMDFQVKIRGFRIELGEIESHLSNHEGVKEAVVIERKDGTGEKYLCAYFTAERNAQGAGRKEIDAGELREYLSATLPDYMIPSYFVPLEKIPLTKNGKLDRKALPEPGIGGGNKYVPPRDRIEKNMMKLWSEVLFGNDPPDTPIGIDDNFFELGGQSLKATVLVYRFHKEFDVKLPLAQIFQTPTIRVLAEHIKGLSKDKYTMIEPVEKKEYYPLSSAQKRLYILQQSQPDNIFYNIPIAVRIESELDENRMKQVFKELIKRHEGLRTSFLLVGNEPVQRIQDEVQFEIECYDSGREGDRERGNENSGREGDRERGNLLESSGREGDRERGNLLEDSGRQGNREIGNKEDLPDTDSQPSELSQRTPVSLSPSLPEFIKNFIHPFDLSQVPLLRVGLVKIESEKPILIVDLHHIVSDGVSNNVMINEFNALYRDEDLPQLRLQYKDFAQWQNYQLQAGEAKKQETYWLKLFEAPVPELKLPFDFPRTGHQGQVGSMIEFELSLDQSNQLRELARAEQMTMYTLLFAIYNVFLFKLSGQEDIVVGTITAGRRHADLESVIGMFVNTLALRNYPSDEITFAEFLHTINQRTVEAFDHQDFQFDDLVEKVLPNRDTSLNPLFDVLFTFVSQEPMAAAKPQSAKKELKTSPYELEEKEGNIKFDLVLEAVDGQGPIRLVFGYSTTLFKTETLERFTVYFKELVSEVLENREIKLKDITISHDLEHSSSELYEATASDFEF